MGHLSGKDIYRKLGRKIDGLTMRAPWNDALRSILEELYTPDEAELVVRMPYVLSPFDRVRKLTGMPASRLKYALDSLCEKGLVVDLYVNGGFHYMPSPLVVGIFEFTMMRTGVNAPLKTTARMFHEYISNSTAFYAANSSSDMRVSVMRSLPHEEAVELSGHVEVLDYEKASSIIMEADRFSLGMCSCRHEKLHAGEKNCLVPLDKCSSFGISAEYLVRHGLARKSSRTEMLENIARSREMGLVLNADNIQKNITFICHCCKCCCNTLLGISRYGYPNTIVTSSLIAHIDQEKCRGCGKCVEACPIQGIDLIGTHEAAERKRKKAMVDASICLGCGVCVLQCQRKAVTLNTREQRVLHPETSFERVILQCLERGTLQNQIFDDPSAVTHKVMRGIIGGFLRLPPVKRALMSNTLRSSFLRMMEGGARLQDKAWVLDI